MKKACYGGIVIYLSLVVMFIGLGILYFLNSTGITIFQNFKTESIRTQLINNINTGKTIAGSSELPDFNARDEIIIETIEDGSIKIIRKDKFALKFWGQNEYATMGNEDHLRVENDFSISLWLKNQSFSGFPEDGILVFGHLDNGNEENDFGYNAFFERFDSNSKSRIKFNLAIIEDDDSHSTISLVSDEIISQEWYFVTITYDGNNLEMYINGGFTDRTIQAGRVDWEDLTSFNGRDFLHVGKISADHSNQLFEGQVRNLGIWDVALTSVSISAIYSQGLSFDPLAKMFNYDSAENLVGFWRMNENSGRILHDLSINNKKGNVNVNGFGPLAIWTTITDSFSYYIQSELNGYERIELFR